MKTVDTDVATARALGITSTPTFVLGRVIDEGQVTVDTVMKGAQPIEAFRKAINEVLARNAER